jgi:hypothetical protein
VGVHSKSLSVTIIGNEDFRVHSFEMKHSLIDIIIHNKSCGGHIQSR